MVYTALSKKNSEMRFESFNPLTTSGVACPSLSKKNSEMRFESSSSNLPCVHENPNLSKKNSEMRFERSLPFFVIPKNPSPFQRRTQK